MFATLLVSCVSGSEKRASVPKKQGPADFPRPLEGSNQGDGSPLVLGTPDVVGDLYLSPAHVLDWDGDGKKNDLVGHGMWGALYTFRFDGSLPDGTPIVDRGLRWGQGSRDHNRQDDLGLCGRVVTTGDFDGDGRLEVILAPRGYSKEPPVVLVPAKGMPHDRRDGRPLSIIDPKLPAGTDALVKWGRAELAALDWDGDGRVDLVAAYRDGSRYQPIQPDTGTVPEDARDRYDRLGRWKGQDSVWSLHLLRNVTSRDRFEFIYAGTIELVSPPPGGPLTAVDPSNPQAGLLILGYYGDLWHLPLKETGSKPKWGELAELLSLDGAPFNRSANMISISVSRSKIHPDNPERLDLFAGDVAYNLLWCRSYGTDRNGRPIYAAPRKVKQRNPHINGGYFSVVTVGDWRGTGKPDLLVGSIEGYIFWYKTLSTNPLRFAPPERVRLGDEELRRFAKPNPSAGYHWGSSQGPSDGFRGGYSNPVLVDWDDDGLLDLIVGDMIGLYDWFPNRGTANQPLLSSPSRLQVDGEPLFGPWRVQPGAADFTGDGLPEIITMDLDLDLVIYGRAGQDDLTALTSGKKLRFEDGATIKTHGLYTPQGGDGRGRTKIHVLDWDHDGKLDLLLGVGPQYGSAFRESCVLLCLNLGSNRQPIYKRPTVLLFDADGEPLKFWRHAAHPTAVDWDGDGNWEILVGADQGFVWYFRPAHFRKPGSQGSAAPYRNARP